MYQKQQHSHFIKSILVMLLIMFSLAPCSVKEVALNSVDVEFIKPSGRSFSLSQNTDCKVLSAIENSALSNTKVSYKNDPTAVLIATNSTAILIPTTTIGEEISNSFSQAILTNYSAKYILYKRLKLGMA
jgi:hypothetical protein